MKITDITDAENALRVNDQKFRVKNYDGYDLAKTGAVCYMLGRVCEFEYSEKRLILIFSSELFLWY